MAKKPPVMPMDPNAPKPAVPAKPPKKPTKDIGTPGDSATEVPPVGEPQNPLRNPLK